MSMAEEVSIKPDTEKLNKVATALKMLIENAYVYGGPRKNLRRIVDAEGVCGQLGEYMHQY